MKLGWTVAQHAIGYRFEELARRVVAPRSDRHYRSRQLDRQAWQAVSDAGLWRLPVPEELGGHGLTWWDFCAALEGITRGGRDLGFCLSLIAHAGLVRALLLFGTPEQQTRYLPRLLSGAVGATALTELTGGSDVARVNTTGHPTGKGYRLIGLKMHITNAPVADFLYVLGRVADAPSKKDITVFLLERSATGVETGPAEEMLGNCSSPTGPIKFNQVFVPRRDILGEVGAGLRLTYRTIALDRLLYGVVGSAYLETLLADTLEYAQSRTAFRQPIADFQYVQRRLTNIKLAVETTRWLSYAALDRLLDDAPEANLFSSAAKLVGSENLAAAALDAMQVFGHRGYENGHPSRSVRDALGTLIAGGTSDIQRKNIFTQMVALSAREREQTPVARAA
jgi:alkylation response protein AidB-like acyl-CoA dehydrogenase